MTAVFLRTKFLIFSALSLFGLIATGQAQAQSVCSSFYSAGFTLSEGKVNPAMPALGKPAKGAVLREPNFNTCLVRATSHSTEPPSTFARNDYSRRQAFNADNTYFIVYSNDGWWHLYNANTLQHLRQLSPRVTAPSTPAQFHMAGDAEPQWHPTDPNVLYYLPTNGGTKLLKLDVRTNAYSIAADFAGKLPSWGASAVHIWTKSEGSPSADGRYWGFQVENNSFGLLGYMVWDLQNNRLAGSYQSNSRPDHSSMSASGRWYITSSDSIGTWAWSPDFTKKKKLHHKSEHSDLAFGPSLQDYYVSVDYQSNAGDVFFTNIDSCPAVAASATDAPICPRTVMFPSYVDGAATAMHFSGKGYSKPGWVAFSTYASSASRNGVYPWFTNKIYALELTANPRAYALAYTRRTESAGGYWSEPHASVSRDFTRVAFNSNWGVNNAEDIDTYVVQIPQSALPGGVTPPTIPPRVTGGNSQPRLSTTGATAASSRPAQGQAGSTAVAPSASTTQGDADTQWTSPGERLLRRTSQYLRQAASHARKRNSAARLALWSVPGGAWWMRSLSADSREARN
jgi:hypothetical protein